MRASAVCLITTGTLLLMGCTCASEPLPESRSDASAERSGAARASTRCELGSAQQTLRAASDMAADEEASDLFAVEVGPALVHSTGFWVPWMSGDGRASSVGLTFLTPALSQARTVSLGAVHWDAAPPRAAHLGEDELLVVVPDADASGDSYRVARVSKGQASWGAELDGSSDDSASFDLAATSQSALLVWDDYHRAFKSGPWRRIAIHERRRVAAFSGAQNRLLVGLAQRRASTLSRAGAESLGGHGNAAEPTLDRGAAPG